MNGMGGWFRGVRARTKASLQRFMTGRYGTDKLNTTILTAGVIVCVISLFISSPVADLALTALAYALMIWAISRSFSRNTYRRYQENRKYLQLLDRVKDRDHKYFDCPRCRQLIRVPRGKGKIAITCPKCREKFIKKT